MIKLNDAGVETFVDVGPGALVSGLVRRNLPHARRISLNSEGLAV